MARGRHQHGDEPPRAVPPEGVAPPPPPYRPEAADPEPANPSPPPRAWTPPPAWTQPPGYYWGPYAPPPVAPRPARAWWWVGGSALTVVLAVVLVGFLMVAVFVLGLLAMANSHPDRSADHAPPLSTPELVQAVSDACERLDEDLALIPPLRATASPERVRRIVDEENDAVAAFLVSVNEAGDKYIGTYWPALPYPRHWEELVAARDRYAFQVATGRGARFVEPMAFDQDRLVSEVIARDGPCPVPERLMDLPDHAPRGQPLVETTR